MRTYESEIKRLLTIILQEYLDIKFKSIFGSEWKNKVFEIANGYKNTKIDIRSLSSIININNIDEIEFNMLDWTALKLIATISKYGRNTKEIYKKIFENDYKENKKIEWIDQKIITCIYEIDSYRASDAHSSENEIDSIIYNKICGATSAVNNFLETVLQIEKTELFKRYVNTQKNSITIIKDNADRKFRLINIVDTDLNNIEKGINSYTEIWIGYYQKYVFLFNKKEDYEEAFTLFFLFCERAYKRKIPKGIEDYAFIYYAGEKIPTDLNKAYKILDDNYELLGNSSKILLANILLNDNFSRKSSDRALEIIEEVEKNTGKKVPLISEKPKKYNMHYFND